MFIKARLKCSVRTYDRAGGVSRYLTALLLGQQFSRQRHRHFEREGSLSFLSSRRFNWVILIYR